MTERDGFINCLQKHKIITSIKETDSWFVKGGCVNFKLPECRNSRPTNVYNIGVKIICDCVEQKQSLLPDYSVYNFVLIFSGYDEDYTEYQCSWHLDYEKNAKDDECDEPKVFHPLFHLTYGGKKMRDIYGHLEGRYSDVKDSSKYKEDNISFIPLLLIAPRIPFPPMDVYLGIDFIICNFMNKRDYQKLQSEPNYKRVIKKSQERLWKPYYLSMANYWEQNSDSSISHSLNQMLAR